MLQDIAILTGGKAFFKDLAVQMENIELAELGRAKKVVVTSENTVIVEGKGNAADISGRVKQIRREIEASDSDYDREKLQERLAKLAGGVAQIYVGATTEVELKERKARVDDALHATRAALEEGVLPGGGTILLRAADRLKSLKLEEEEACGVDAVRKALECPTRQIMENAGLDGAIVVKRIREEKGSYGYDVISGKYCDLYDAGVIDPTKVVRCALQNAASVAGLLLTTEALVTEAPKKDSAGADAAPGMEGMM
jgi:chaperonin GroEL